MMSCVPLVLTPVHRLLQRGPRDANSLGGHHVVWGSAIACRETLADMTPSALFHRSAA